MSAAAALDLAQLARALGGEIAGGQVLAPGPGHSPRDRSLSVRPSAQSPFGFIAHSHSGDDWRDCRDFVLRKLGSPASWTPHDLPRAGRSATRATAGTDLWKEIWCEAEPLGAMAFGYFASRGIHEVPLPDVHAVMRFHPHCIFGPCQRHPCIVALFRDVATDRPVAVHRTALTRDGKKLGRKALGPKTRAAIKLWPDEEVTASLVIGEGLETTLSAAARVEHRGTLLQPAWALGDAGNLAAFPVLAGIECLTILVDNDKSGAGQRAALKSGERWRAVGRQVLLLTPRAPGDDFNDLVEGPAS
jgi:hypothetical protein